MNFRRPKPQNTRAARKRKDALLRAGIWVFLVIFALSSVGFVLGVFVKP
ncbi:MAG TPA: hypothetical protein VJP85_07425 [Candidatus Baltobacteraceae bacterium]|nr:hypothetical protein [Candidatus Baltobacteraceae bacterium]